MTATRKNLKNQNLKKKIASLSALGAGALVLGAGTAEAGIIYSGPLDVHVGYGPLGTAFYGSPGLGANSAYFSFSRQSTSSSSNAPGLNARLVGAYGCGCLQMAQQLGLLQLFNVGAKWTNALVGGSTLLVGGRAWGGITGYVPTNTTTSSPASTTTFQPVAIRFGLPSFSDQYALFQFIDGPDTRYGWIHLSFSVDAQFGSDPNFGPNLIVHDWAYDDAGQALEAGQTLDATSTPEPGTVVSTGLAALVLGAVGLRGWRKTRKAAEVFAAAGATTHSGN